MWKNYLKTAWRSLLNNRVYSLINLVGLSVGVAVSLLLFHFAFDEWSYDEFHPEADQLSRAWVKEHIEDEVIFNTVAPIPLGRVLKENLPEIAAMSRLVVFNDLVKEGEFSEAEALYLAEPDFFHMFAFPLVQGDTSGLFHQLNQVVLSTRLAEKYFGTRPALGKTLTIQVSGEWQPFQVAGIIDEPPSNSSIQAELILPFAWIEQFMSERARSNWQNVSAETYVKLRDGISPVVLKEKFAPIMDQQVADIFDPGGYEVGFQPITDIHLNPDFPVGIAPVSDAQYPYIMSGIALLILLLAGINFTTLAVARSESRTKEVGIRKVSGARRLQLIVQFWTEATLMVVLAIALGILLAELALPTFNELAGKNLILPYTFSFVLLLIAAAIAMGLLTSIYPALILSGIQPIHMVRNTVLGKGRQKHLVLRSLIVVQFVLSIVLVVCTLIMQQQLRFLQQKNLGYVKDQVLVLPIAGNPTPDQPFSAVYAAGIQMAERLQQALRNQPEVKGLSYSSHALGTPGWAQVGYQDPISRAFRRFRFNAVGEEFLPMMEISLKDGRSFDPDKESDRQGVIINEAFAKAWEMDQPVGQFLPEPFETFQIIGLTEDFQYASLHQAVEPLVIGRDALALLQRAPDLNFGDSPTPKISIKLATTDLQQSLQDIQLSWTQVAPDQPFNYHFVDEALDQQYRAEAQLGEILSLATMLAMFIAGLGLFGMASLTLAKRTREIGVRKVLGASAWGIFLLLNKRFTWMVIIATPIAAILGAYLMQSWLNDFAYRISLNVWIFLGAGFLALLMAWVAVSYQAIRAARINPIESLRHE